MREGVESVRQVTDDTLERSAEIFGRRRTWGARIIEQRLDERVDCVATEGERIDGTVEFEPIDTNRTRAG